MPERRQADVRGVNALTSEFDLEEEEEQEAKEKQWKHWKSPGSTVALSPKGN